MKNNNKIAFLHSNLKFGGAEKVSINLAVALKEKGYEIDFLLMSYEGDFLITALNNFNVINLNCSKTYKLPFKLFFYFLKNKPSAIISSFWKLNICACLIKLFFPYIKLAVWEHSPPSKSKNSSIFYGISSSLLYQLATKVVCVSSSVANDLLKKTFCLNHIVEVIPNAVPRPLSLPQVVGTRLTKSKKIIWVGRLDEPKNPELALDAVSKLPCDFEYVLTFIGDGRLKSVLQNKADSMGIKNFVRFEGFQLDPYSYMLNSDLLLISSDHEGLPTVLIEGLYAGLRVVSTDCSQAISDLLDNGKYGSLVPIQSPQEMAAAIIFEAGVNYDKNVQRMRADLYNPNEIANIFIRSIGLDTSKKIRLIDA